MPESIESSKFVSHRTRMSGEFHSKKESHSTKFEQRPQIFITLSFRELFDSKLSGLTPFGNMVITHWVKNKWETLRQTEVIFVTPTENSSVVTNDTQGPQKYPNN